MPRSPLKRALGSLRKLVRRRRVPGPTEQQWLRLILLVRRLQHGQLAFGQRLDEIRTLTGQMGSFRSDFGALHHELGAAREAAADLERGLSERLRRLDRLPDPAAEREALDERLELLDELAGRLERHAGQVPGQSAPGAEVGAQLARLGELATRFEACADAERASGGQEELARLYERIQELAEGLGAPSAAPAGLEAIPEGTLARLDERLGNLEAGLEALASGTALGVEDTLERLEGLAQRLERRGAGRSGAGLAPEELIPLVARLEELTVRLEQTPTLVPELPQEATLDPAQAHELEELRIQLACEHESRRRVDGELVESRERLRASELARVELETRHTTEMAQMADHVSRQLQRVEDDLKKKKRGLAELTQQNIALQSRLNELQARLGLQAPAGAEPPPALPRPTSERPRSGTPPEGPA